MSQLHYLRSGASCNAYWQHAKRLDDVHCGTIPLPCLKHIMATVFSVTCCTSSQHIQQELLSLIMNVNWLCCRHFRACSAGRLDSARALVEGGKAKLESKDASGATPMGVAASCGDQTMTLYLLSKGADPEVHASPCLLKLVHWIALSACLSCMLSLFLHAQQYASCLNT